jgi:acetyl esterase/lipase
LWIIQDPKTKPDVVIFYCHGGGFVLGSAYFYLEFLLTWISVLVDYGFKNPAIFALEYTLVPDESYPCQLEETIKGYSYARTITGDPGRVVVSGDSAGATLILSLLLYLGAKCPEEKPRFASLISPWTNLTSKLHRNTAADYLDADTLHKYAQLYAGTADLCDPLLSPGECDDMQWLAASLPRKGIGLYYGSEEVFCDAVRAFAERLKKVGRVICRENEAVHAWPVAVLFLGSSHDERLKGLRQISNDISAVYSKYGVVDSAY